MNKRLLLVLSLLLAGLLALSACGATLPPPKAGGAPQQASSSGGPKVSSAAQQFAKLQGDPGKGKNKFEATCSTCHGVNAKGMPGNGKDLTTSTFTKGLSNADFILFVTKGRPTGDKLNTTGIDMPTRGGNPSLSNQDLADIISYVRSLEVKK